jgi:hypothetical protein
MLGILRSARNFFSHACPLLASELSLRHQMPPVYNREGPHSALALRPFLIYCASPLISPLLIPHFE